MTDAEAIAALVSKASQWSDGHFTICKFSSNWRVSFATPSERCDICRMHEGKTLVEAATAAIAAGKPTYDADKHCACHAAAIADEDDMFALFCATPEGSA